MAEQAHILVVDDEPAIGDLIRSYLSRHGFRVSVVADGAGLKRAMAESKPDLVLLDLGLPGEDGLTLTRQIRAQSDIGVIIVTGSGNRWTALSAWAWRRRLRHKPFDLRELLAHS
jgi:DNA-binding response OmpR family regulator